jgi:hypothetical protein
MSPDGGLTQTTMQDWWDALTLTTGWEGEFERRYHAFMERGGFAQRCLNEGFELLLRMVPMKDPAKYCMHGAPLLTCPSCNRK